MNPAVVILALLIGLPLVELYVMIKVGNVIGAFPTVVMVVLTAVIGSWLVRIQGLSQIRAAQAALAAGVMPAREIISGAILALSGLLLLLPGFLTDLLGALGLIPPVRNWLVDCLIARFPPTGPGGFPPDAGSGQGPRVIEGEYTRVDRDR